jgi:rubrerythrin
MIEDDKQGIFRVCAKCGHAWDTEDDVDDEDHDAECPVCHAKDNSTVIPWRSD